MARGTFQPVFFLAAVFAVSGLAYVPPPPENVRIISENLGLQLIWDPPVNTRHTLVTYTTEYKSWSDSFNPACVNQSETSCDVTSKISPFGKYELRVRAALQGLYSDWVQKDPFIVNERTNISAPRVKLLSRKGDIEVQISDPVMITNNFQEMYHPVEYVVTYWKDGDTDRPVQKRSSQNHVILPAADLSAEGSYCVQVHISMPVYNKNSSASNHTCIDIAPDGLAYVPPPENVRIISENLGLQLIWDPPVNTRHTLVTYTTEYKSWSGSFNPACVNQSETSCDVISKISPFGKYELRVRAALQGLYSDWVQKDPFIVNERTNISAPRVKLLSRKGDIEVQISDPVMITNNFQEMYHPVEYVVTYWKDGDTDRPVQKRSSQNHVILPAADLSAEGSYCVQVQISMPMYNKNSSASNHTCIDIAPDDKVAGWQIMLVMLGSFLTVAVGLLLLFGVGWYSYRCLHYIHPKASLPEHFFKQHSFSQMEQTKGVAVELCDPVSIMEAPQPPLLEGGAHCRSHTQPLLQPQGKMEGQ